MGQAKPKMDGIKDKYLNIIEHVYGIPRILLEDMTYDKIEDYVYNELQRREREKEAAKK